MKDGRKNFKRQQRVNAADAADDNHQTEYDEQHARQKARADERENAERRRADANQQLKRVGGHAAGENKGKNVEHAVNGDACADEHDENIGDMLGREEQNDA